MHSGSFFLTVLPSDEMCSCCVGNALVMLSLGPTNVKVVLRWCSGGVMLLVIICTEWNSLSSKPHFRHKKTNIVYMFDSFIFSASDMGLHIGDWDLTPNMTYSAGRARISTCLMLSLWLRTVFNYWWTCSHQMARGRLRWWSRTFCKSFCKAITTSSWVLDNAKCIVYRSYHHI